MDLRIAGRWALVCGASKGLGFGCAQALAREGVNQVIVARNADALLEAASQIRAIARAGQVIAVVGDVSTQEGREAALSARGGPGRDFDILLNNSGGPPPGDFREWDDEHWHSALNANMLGPIAMIRAVIDGMAERGFGRIVNITSVAVKAPIANLGLSNGARSGLTGFIAGLARSRVARGGVTINNLLPGSFATSRLIAVMENEARSRGIATEELVEARRNGIPAGRLGTAEEFGEVFAFLCSEQAGYITGQNILCDGGAYPGAH